LLIFVLLLALPNGKNTEFWLTLRCEKGKKEFSLVKTRFFFQKNQKNACA